jgi:hypothetical protein
MEKSHTSEDPPRVTAVVSVRGIRLSGRTQHRPKKWLIWSDLGIEVVDVVEEAEVVINLENDRWYRAD